MGLIATIFSKNKNNGKGKSQSGPFSLNKADFQEAYKKLKESTSTYRQSFSQPEAPVITQPVLESPIQEEPVLYVPTPLKVEGTSLKNENEPILPNGFTEQSKIIDGVIWSEILGEPRARSPYFAKKRR